MGLTFGFHWMHSCPAKIRAKCLGARITHFGLNPRKHRVRKNIVDQSPVPHHAVVSRKSPRQRGIHIGPDTSLCGHSNSIQSFLVVNTPSTSQRRHVNLFAFLTVYIAKGWSPCYRGRHSGLTYCMMHISVQFSAGRSFVGLGIRYYVSKLFLPIRENTKEFVRNVPGV